MREPGFDLLGCEYLGGCPAVGSRVLNKVQVHFDYQGVTVAVAPQGLFTPAAARPVITLAWPEISALSTTDTYLRPATFTAGRLIHSVVKLLTMRLDLPDRLAIATPAWTMTIGVRAQATELARELQDLLAGHDGPVPVVTLRSV